MHPRLIRLAALAFVAAAPLAFALTIVVDPGPFGDIDKAASAEKQVNWWDDDQADDTACTLSFAARELAAFLPQCTSLKAGDISLSSPGQLPGKGDVVILLSGAGPVPGEVLKAEDTAAPDAAEGYHIRSLARDGRTITVIRGHDRVGALYGAYAWLERLGMRFYGLGEQGTVRPKQPSAIPADLNASAAPSYLTRGFWAWEDRGNNDFYLWMARNRLNLWTPASVNDIPLLKKLGIKLIAAHHDVQHFCLSPKAEYPFNRAGFDGDDAKPADPYAPGSEFAGDTDKDGKLTYFEAHPEWYCLKAGKRSDRIAPEFGDNFCTSNADARTELVRNLVNHCVEGRWKYADVLNFWMLDGGKWCECPECAKQGTYTDRLMIVIDGTLRGLKAARQAGRLKRPLQLVTLAYHETLAPPTRPLPEGFDYGNLSVTYFPIERCYAHPLADPTCTEVNERMAREYQGWALGAGRHYQGSLFIGEYYNVSGLKSIPVLFQKIMAVDIPWYYRMGARHFHYMHTPTRLWGTWTLNQYQMARLLWNVNESSDELIDDYFEQYYPATASRMRGFYRDLELATANCKILKHYVTTPRGGYSLRAAMIKEHITALCLTRRPSVN